MELLKYALPIFLLIQISFAKPQKSATGIIHVNGTLHCSPSHAHSAHVFPNAVVQVACTKDVIANAPASAKSNSNGMYLVVLIPRPNAAISSILSACKIFVLMHLSNCNPKLPSNGLVSTLNYVENVHVGSSYVTYLAPTGFTMIRS